MKFLDDNFTGRISRFGYKIKDLDVRTEFQITHESKNAASEIFLAGFAKEYNPSIQDCFIGSAWDNIKFTPDVATMSIQFHGINVTAKIKTIKVTRKETKNDVVYKYDILFEKDHNKEDDYQLATYLNSKIEDENGKKEIEWFDVEVSEL